MDENKKYIGTVHVNETGDIEIIIDSEYAGDISSTGRIPKPSRS